MHVFAAVGVFALLVLPVQADPTDCAMVACPAFYELHSVSDTKSYGLLVEAPQQGCRYVRYRVQGAGAADLGHTPPLRPGDVAVVRMGRGFASGGHLLTVSAKGCSLQPALMRRVTLGKASPDHGWRAAD